MLASDAVLPRFGVLGSLLLALIRPRQRLVRRRQQEATRKRAMQGRKTGQPRTNPVVPVEHDGRRWLVAPYGPVSWVHNARAAGRVSLTRRRDTRDYIIREVSPAEAGPVLRRYVRISPSTRPYFQATKNSPVEDFITEADRHPVFELIPAGEDRHRRRPAR